MEGTTNRVLISILTMVARDDLFERLFSGEQRFKPGHSFLIKGKKVGKAFGYLADLMNRDYKGLYVTRQHPDHLDTSNMKERPRIIWLSTTLGKDYVDPQNLGNLTAMINKFTEDNEKSVILMDGLEYLMISNDFQRIISFLEYVNEIVMRNRSVLFLAIDERAFDEKQLALLERNMEIVA